MDQALEDIFSPLRGDFSLADSTNSASSVGTPLSGQQSLEKLLPKKLRVSNGNDTFSETTVESDVMETKTKTGLESIGEEEDFLQAEDRGAKKAAKRKSAKLKSRMSLSLEPCRPRGPEGRVSGATEKVGTKESGKDSVKNQEVSARISGATIVEEKVGKKEAENSTKREERRKSKSKESEEHSLKNQMAAMEKSVRLAVSMEFDALRSVIFDQQVLLHRKLDRILEESQRTQLTNAHLLSAIEKQNEIQQRLLSAILSGK